MKKGSSELPWIIHINRAFELQFGGDDLVRLINRSTQCTYGYVKVLHFSSQWNCEVFSWKFHYEWSLSLIKSHLWIEFLLAELRSGTPSRISMGRTGSEYLHNLEKLLFRRDRAVLYKYGSVVIRRRKTAGGVPVLILISVWLNLQSCQWADSGIKGKKS